MNIILANPRGFCAGVDRAIAIVEEALQYFKTVYVRHEIVHNRFIVEQLKKKGVIFVEALSEIPEGELVIFSAHGVSEKIEEESKKRNLKIIDATCPLVTKVHLEVIRYQKEKRSVIMIGHKGHPEVEGTLGRYQSTHSEKIYLVENTHDVQALNLPSDLPVAYITQTTLSVDDTQPIIQEICKQFSNLAAPKTQDICYATQNRQAAVKKILPMVDVLIIVGSQNSSNSNRLKEIGEEQHIPSYLIDSEAQIDLAWLSEKSRVGISSGASAPELLVSNVIAFLKKHYQVDQVLNIQTAEEHTKFSLPNIQVLSQTL